MCSNIMYGSIRAYCSIYAYGSIYVYGSILAYGSIHAYSSIHSHGALSHNVESEAMRTAKWLIPSSTDWFQVIIKSSLYIRTLSSSICTKFIRNITTALWLVTIAVDKQRRKLSLPRLNLLPTHQYGQICTYSET
jgi:hypothetical protein